MKIIPVIDLKNRQVVHAKSGLRENYRPVNSQICENADPVNIVQSFLDLHAFDVIYIADIDAIEGTGNNNDKILSIQSGFPGLNIWLDNGIDNFGPFRQIESISPVFGSETGKSLADIKQLILNQDNTILSLDFRGEQFLGDKSILENNNNWPENIIVMNLARVGSNDGPDFRLLEKIMQQAGDRKVYCGGGIRTLVDLQQLVRLGIYGVLTATAIHNKIIDKNLLLEFQ